MRYATKDPQSYVKSNIEGFMTLLEAARSVEPKPRIVYASSSSVYGLNTKARSVDGRERGRRRVLWRRGCCG